MPSIFNSIRSGIANFIDPNKKITNAFADAFYKYLGHAFLPYDQNRKTYLEKGYGHNPDVYAVIQQMSTKTSSVPFIIKEVKDKSQKKQLDKLYKTTKGLYSPQQEIKKRILQTKAFEEKELSFPLEKPNPLQTWSEIWSLYKTFLRITGEVYFYMLRPEEGPNAGKPLQVYVLPSHLMNIVLKRNIDLAIEESPIDYYKLIEGHAYTRFEEKDVIHVKLPNPFYDRNGSHLYGLSPLKAALRNIQSSNEAIDLNNKTLKNGGAFGLIHAKGNPLTPEQAKSIKDRLEEMDANPERLAKIAGISSEVGFTRISLTTDELKPFDFIKNDQKTICNVLGWSDKLLNNDDGSKSHLNGMNQAWQSVVVNNIMPDLKLLEEALNSKFLPLFKGYEKSIIQWDASELPEMQQDMEKMIKWLSQALSDGVITRNEYRIATKYPETNIPEMDVHTVGINIIPLEDALIPGEEFNNNND